MPDKVKEIGNHEVVLEKWHEKNALIEQQSAVTISNSLFLQIESKSTIYKYYKALKIHFEDHSIIIFVKLRCQLGWMKLKESEDV